MHYIRRVRYDAWHMRVFLGLFTAYLALSIPLALSQNVRETAMQDWPAYGGGPPNIHYSSLAQINRTNVKRLQVAWTFDTGEQGGLQTSPIIVAGVLYGITPTQKVFALNAATGKHEEWARNLPTVFHAPDLVVVVIEDGNPIPENLLHPDVERESVRLGERAGARW